jgi:GNAT superfamily N-acetyltransferase
MPHPGRIHWVMMTPSFQGRGLAKPLLAAACHRLHELGHQTAELVTDSLRLPAINLYFKFGFVPMPQGEADTQFWCSLQTEPIKRQKSPT